MCVCGGGYGSIRAEDRLCFLLLPFSAVGIVCVCRERERNLVMPSLMEDDDIIERMLTSARLVFWLGFVEC